MSKGKDTDKAKCAKQIATSLQIPFERGVVQSDARWYIDLLCLTICGSSRNFHSTRNGNSTWGIGSIVFQPFWTTGSFVTKDSCAAVEVVQKVAVLPGIRGAFRRFHGAYLSDEGNEMEKCEATDESLVEVLIQPRLTDHDPFPCKELVKLLGCRFS